MDCSEADILIFNLQRKCKKNCRGSCGDSRWCREVWGRSHASQIFLYVLISHMMFSREFAFCLFINYAYICMWMHVHKQDDNWKKQFSGVPSRGLTEMEIQAKKFYSFLFLFLWNKPENHNWIHWKPTSGHRCSLLRGGRKWKSECPGGRGYSEFQVTGMNKWEGKSKPKTIPCRASNKTQKIPLPKMNPQKSHAEIPEPWKFSKNILNFPCCMI